MKTYSGSKLDILIDQGKDDQFLSAGQLLPDNFTAACSERKIPVVFRLQEASITSTPPTCCVTLQTLGVCKATLRHFAIVGKAKTFTRRFCRRICECFPLTSFPHDIL